MNYVGKFVPYCSFEVTGALAATSGRTSFPFNLLFNTLVIYDSLNIGGIVPNERFCIPVDKLLHVVQVVVGQRARLTKVSMNGCTVRRHS